jgi:hypothetical protein
MPAEFLIRLTFYNLLILRQNNGVNKNFEQISKKNLNLDAMLNVKQIIDINLDIDMTFLNANIKYFSGH